MTWHINKIFRLLGPSFFVFILTAGFLLVPAVFALAQAPQETANIEAALTELGTFVGAPVETVEEAKVICNKEENLTKCAEIGKEHGLYSAEETKQVDAVLTELKGTIKDELEACTNDTCLIGVANRLAQQITKRNPSAAKALELTAAKVQEKKAVIDTAKEIGVDFKTCKEMDPDTAPIDVLRACARLAKDERVRKIIPEEARAIAETRTNLIEAKSTGSFAGCGDGTIDGCGNFCFSPENIAKGEPPQICLQLARTVFKDEGGEKALRDAYRQVAAQTAQAELYYTKRAENIVFKTRDGRVISDPPEIGRYLEERGRSGDVDEVERGMDFMVSNGFIRTQDKEYAVSFVKKIREQGQGKIINFDECASNPDACAEFVPEEHQDEFDEFKKFDDAMRRNIGFDPEQCRRSQSDENTSARCTEGAKKAIQELQSQGIKSVNVTRVIDELKQKVETGERRQSRKTEFDRTIRSQGGPGGCRAEQECRNYCSRAENSPECISFGAKQGIFRSDEVVRKFTQFQTAIQAPQYVPGAAYPSYPTQGAPFYGTGPYPGFVPPGTAPYQTFAPGQVSGFTQPGPGFYGQPIPVVSYISPDCLLAIQSGDFVRAKIACQVARPTPPPIVGPICPSLPTLDPEECRRNGGEPYVTYSSRECGDYFGCRPVAVRQANTRVYLKPASSTQFDKYFVVIEDPEGINAFSVTTVKDGNVYGGNPSCVPQVTSGTVTLQGEDFPLRVKAADCSKPAQDFFGDVWPPARPSVGYCGDKICDANETVYCPADCGGPTPSGSPIVVCPQGQYPYYPPGGGAPVCQPGGGSPVPTPSSSCPSDVLKLFNNDTGCHWMYSDSSGKPIYCNGQMTQSAQQGDAAAKQGCTGPGYSPTPVAGCGNYTTQTSCGSLGGCVWDTTQNLCKSPSCLGYTKATCEAEQGCKWSTTSGCGSAYYPSPTPSGSPWPSPTYSPSPTVSPTGTPVPGTGPNSSNVGAQTYAGNSTSCPCWNNFCPSTTWLSQGTYCIGNFSGFQYCVTQTGSTHLNPGNYTTNCPSGVSPTPSPSSCGTYTTQSPCQSAGCSWAGTYCYSSGGGGSSCSSQQVIDLGSGCHFMGDSSGGQRAFNGSMTAYWSAVGTGSGSVVQCSTTNISGCSGGGGYGCGTYTSQSSCSSAGCSWYYPSSGSPYCTSPGSGGGCGQYYSQTSCQAAGCLWSYNACSPTSGGGGCSSYASQSTCTAGGCAWSSSSTCVPVSSTPENCTNGIDDDGDGWIDAADPGCGGSGGGGSCSCPTGSTATPGGGSPVPTFCKSNSDPNLCGYCGSTSLSGFSSSQCQSSGASPTPWPSPTSSSCPSGYHSMSYDCMSDADSTKCQPFGGGTIYTCSGSYPSPSPSYSPWPSPSFSPPPYSPTPTPTPPTCTSPAYFDPSTGSCVTPTPTSTPPPPPTPTPTPSCAPPTYYDSSTNSCVTPPSPPPTSSAPFSTKHMIAELLTLLESLANLLSSIGQ